MEHISKIINIFLYIFFCLIWVSLNVLIAYCARDLHLDCMLSACCLHAVYILSTCCLHISLLWMHLRSVELLFLFGCCRMLPPRSRFFFFSQWPRFVPDLSMVLSDWIGNWAELVAPSLGLRASCAIKDMFQCSTHVPRSAGKCFASPALLRASQSRDWRKLTATIHPVQHPDRRSLPARAILTCLPSKLIVVQHTRVFHKKHIIFIYLYIYII